MGGRVFFCGFMNQNSQQAVSKKKVSVIGTSVAPFSKHPMIPMSPQMMQSIRQAPKGKIPPGLARYLANKKKGAK